MQGQVPERDALRTAVTEPRSARWKIIIYIGSTVLSTALVGVGILLATSPLQTQNLPFSEGTGSPAWIVLALTHPRTLTVLGGLAIALGVAGLVIRAMLRRCWRGQLFGLE